MRICHTKSMFIFYFFILPREKIQEQFVELDDADWHSKCHFLVLILSFVLPGPKRPDQSVTSSFQGVSVLASVPVLWAGGLCTTNCSDVNTAANIFICIIANVLALYI